MIEQRRGSCLCGAVTLVAAGAPLLVAACHCDSCRKHTGAPCAVYADYPGDRVTFTAGRPTEYRSSANGYRGFCGVCGSTIYFRGANLPAEIHLHIGVFDDPRAFQPRANEAEAQRMPWLHIDCA